MVRTLTLFLALFCTLLAAAQDLTGIWRGTFYNEYEYLFTGAKYRYEVQIKTTGLQAKGVTYSYQTTRFYGKASMVGKWSPSSKDLTLVENKMLDLKIAGGGDGCLMTCYLRYRKEGGREYLEGTYSSVNMKNDTAQCGGGVVRLEKVPDSDFELEDFLKDPKETVKGTKPGQGEFLIKKTPTAPPSATNPGTNPNATSKAGSTAKGNAPKPSTSSTKPPVNTKPGTNSGSTSKATTTPTSPKPPTQGTIAKSNTTKPAANATGTTPPKSVPPVTEKAKDEPASAGTPQKLVVLPPPPEIKNRKNEIVETISTAARKLEVSFYDNGEIDGDTITVYANNKLLVSKKGLSADPITITVALGELETDQEIVMVAENLGSIPPNTALMIVQAGAQRYAVRLSSNEQKNAVVRFKYDPNALK